jgi:hypothetical protein
VEAGEKGSVEGKKQKKTAAIITSKFQNFGRCTEIIFVPFLGFNTTVFQIKYLLVESNFLQKAVSV